MTPAKTLLPPTLLPPPTYLMYGPLGRVGKFACFLSSIRYNTKKSK